MQTTFGEKGEYFTERIHSHLPFPGPLPTGRSSWLMGLVLGPGPVGSDCLSPPVQATARPTPAQSPRTRQPLSGCTNNRLTFKDTSPYFLGVEFP